MCAVDDAEQGCWVLSARRIGIDVIHYGRMSVSHKVFMEQQNRSHCRPTSSGAQCHTVLLSPFIMLRGSLQACVSCQI